jgi:hypothetical protein
MIGSIYLFDFDGALLKFAQYESVGHRNRIIDGWRKLIGKKFGRMYLQVAPGLASRARPKI